jgi:predicted nucleic acid-binding protein
MRLARAHRLTMYDAIYLDLAIRFAAPLATRDKALRQVASETGVALIET